MRLFVGTHQSAATLRDSWKVLTKGYKKSDMHQEVGRVLWNELEPSFQVRTCIVHVAPCRLTECAWLHMHGAHRFGTAMCLSCSCWCMQLYVTVSYCAGKLVDDKRERVKQYNTSFFRQLQLCTVRQFMITARNTPVSVGGIVKGVHSARSACAINALTLPCDCVPIPIPRCACMCPMT